jgi:hypothetical protein
VKILIMGCVLSSIDKSQVVSANIIPSLLFLK